MWTNRWMDNEQTNRCNFTNFKTKISRVSRIQAITDKGTGEEKRTGEVPT